MDRLKNKVKQFKDQIAEPPNINLKESSEKLVEENPGTPAQEQLSNASINQELPTIAEHSSDYTGQDHTAQDHTTPNQLNLNRTTPDFATDEQTGHLGLDRSSPVLSEHSISESTSPQHTTPHDLSQLKTQDERASSELPPLKTDDWALSKIDDDPANTTFCERCQASVSEDHVCYGAGTVIGKTYQVISMLGEGGMGTVYKAKHLLMKRMVAVKVLNPRLGLNADIIRRFQREAQAAGRLDHTNIVKINEFSTDDNGLPYLVMDYIEGQPLSRMIRSQGTLSTERLVHIMTQVCDALEHAHKRGIVHRDLKPSNIVVLDTEERKEEVKILDFGIAKIIEGAESESMEMKLTHTGRVLGSPVYMSPEQCQAKPLDARSDIYSLGCVLFESITGRLPFVGSNLVETLYMQTHKMPPSVNSIRPDIVDAARLDAIILKCMAKDPRDRYQTMAELKTDLLALTEIRDEGWLARAQDFWHIQSRRRTATQAPQEVRSLSLRVIGVSALLSAVALGASFWLLTSFSVPSDKDWSSFDIKGQQEFDSGNFEKAKESFSYALRKAAGSTVQDPLVAIGLARFDPKSLATVTKQKNDDPQFLSTLKELSDLYTAQGDNAKAGMFSQNLDKGVSNRDLSKNEAEEAIADLNAELRTKSEEQIEASLQRIIALTETTSPFGKERIELQQRIIELLEKEMGPQHRFVGRAYNNIAILHMARGAPKTAHPYLLRALDIIYPGHALEKDKNPVYKDDPQRSAIVMHTIGKNFFQCGQYEQSIRYLLKSINLAIQSKGGSTDADFAEAHLFIGRASLELGKLHQAASEIKIALRMYAATRIKAGGTLSDNEIFCHDILSTIEERLSSDGKISSELRAQHAKVALREAMQELTMVESCTTKNDRLLAHVLMRVAKLSHHSDKTISPAALYKRATAILLRANPMDVSMLDSALTSQVQNEMISNELLQAFLTRLSERTDAETVSQQEKLQGTKLVARMYRRMMPPELHKSAAAWEKAVNLSTSNQSQQDLFESLSFLAATYLDMGERDNARRVLSRGLDILHKVGAGKLPNQAVNELVSRQALLLEEEGKASEARQLRKAYLPRP